MPAAARADPELIGRPRHTGAGIAHLHLRSAPLTANLEPRVAHGRILTQNQGIAEWGQILIFAFAYTPYANAKIKI
jgi:hypothetical protein